MSLTLKIKLKLGKITLQFSVMQLANEKEIKKGYTEFLEDYWSAYICHVFL